MNWQNIRQAYPQKWIVAEALEAHSEKGYRILDQLSVVQVCEDSKIAMNSCFALQNKTPQREFYFLHTNRETLEIKERHWFGIRGGEGEHSNS